MGINYFRLKIGTDTTTEYLLDNDCRLAKNYTEDLPLSIEDVWLEFDGDINLCMNFNKQVENQDIYITGSLEYEDSSEETHNENVDYNATIDQPSSYLAVTLTSVGMNILWATADVEIWDDDTGTLLFRGEVTW